MATRVRVKVVQTASGITVSQQSGEDGSLPSDAPASTSEYANVGALNDAILDAIATFKGGSGLAMLALLSLLRANQGDPTKLVGATASAILDEDVGQFGVRFVAGS